MAVEGEYPKADGDILFASEANRVSPKLIGNLNQSGRIDISGTNFTQMGGSILYPGTGSLAINDFMQIQVGTGQQASVATIGNFRVRISGTAGLDIVSPTWSIPTSPASYGLTINHILTSGVMTASGGNIGSSYSISLEGQNDTSNINAAMFGDFVIIGY